MGTSHLLVWVYTFEHQRGRQVTIVTAVTQAGTVTQALMLESSSGRKRTACYRAQLLMTIGVGGASTNLSNETVRENQAPTVATRTSPGPPAGNPLA
jgi:hypothetical protein